MGANCARQASAPRGMHTWRAFLFQGTDSGMAGHFAKPSLTIDQQIAHLRAAGMAIADEERARHWLSHVSYYRLSGYWHIWKDRTGPVTRFLPGTDLDRVCDLYSFDRKLRRLVARATEHVEVALRGSWALALAHRGGSHDYLNAALYSDRRAFHDLLAKLARETGSSPETYIRHYRENYDEPAIPPVWMVAEMMTFGQISRWYSLLDDRALRSQIAAPFNLPETVLIATIKHLVDVRNICAHQGRLWNRGFRSPPKLPLKPPALTATIDHSRAGHAAGTLYNSLVLLVFLLDQTAPASTWRADLTAHLLAHPIGDLAAMGFPPDWQTRPLWVRT